MLTKSNCENERRAYQNAVNELKRLEDEIVKIPAQEVPPGGHTPAGVNNDLTKRAIKAREQVLNAKKILDACEGKARTAL